MLQDMKRRRFLQTIAAAPAAPAVLAAQQTAPRTVAPPAPAAVKLLATAPADVVAELVPRFFTHAQFEALQKLSDVLVPAGNGTPGAVDAEVPQFIDFLIGQSPAERKQLYRAGLDLLNAHAAKLFNKPFGALDVKQADSILRPLMVPVPWAYDPPKDLGSHFATTAHEDIRTATRNSRQWAEASKKAGRRIAGPQLYWNEIDPIYKG
jgi:gluconate 2-dehydrogenase subunit 3-like protein